MRPDGTVARNVADLTNKYVATEVLQRLKTQLGVVSNYSSWFKYLATDAHDTDDHVDHAAPVVTAQMLPPPRPPPYWEWPALPSYPAYRCTLFFSGWPEDCPESVAMARVPLEPLLEATTGEQQAVDLAALSGSPRRSRVKVCRPL